MYNDDDLLLLSGIQHFSFCRRQWALIHIEQQWAENWLTAEGRVVHERVHEQNLTDMRGGVLTVRGLQIKSNRLGLTGVCDAVEFVPSPSGIPLQGRKGLWQPFPVEYKHGEPKTSDCDRLQTVAQVICLEEMFCCKIPYAWLFYKETGRREKVETNEEIREKVAAMTEEMHTLFAKGYTPKVKTGKSCQSCSLKDICLPKLQGEKNRSALAYIHEHLQEE